MLSSFSKRIGSQPGSETSNCGGLLFSQGGSTHVGGGGGYFQRMPNGSLQRIPKGSLDSQGCVSNHVGGGEEYFQRMPSGSIQRIPKGSLDSRGHHIVNLPRLPKESIVHRHGSPIFYSGSSETNLRLPDGMVDSYGYSHGGSIILYSGGI
jgi:hypothetical protein